MPEYSESFSPESQPEKPEEEEKQEKLEKTEWKKAIEDYIQKIAELNKRLREATTPEEREEILKEAEEEVKKFQEIMGKAKEVKEE